MRTTFFPPSHTSGRLRDKYGKSFSPPEYKKQTSNISTACKVVAVPLTNSSLFPKLIPGREKLLLVMKPLVSEPVKPSPRYQITGQNQYNLLRHWKTFQHTPGSWSTICLKSPLISVSLQGSKLVIKHLIITSGRCHPLVKPMIH